MLHLLHRVLRPRQCYDLCSVARSGAHLLLAGLRATGMAGRPLQYFHAQLAPKYAARYGLDATNNFGHYVRGIVRASATRNSVFGFHLEAWDLERFIGQLRDSGEFGNAETNERELLQAAFPRLRCIQLTRGDKLRQAISKARAMQTDHWVVRAGESPAQEPVFDPELIAHCHLSAISYNHSRSRTKSYAPIILAPSRACSIFSRSGRCATLFSGHQRLSGKRTT